MGSPIVIPQRQSPWAQLLPQMFLMKIQHNQAMDREELRIKARQAELKEQKELEGRKERARLRGEGRSPVDKPVEGGTFNPITGQEFSAIPPERIITDPNFPDMIFKISPNGKLQIQNRSVKTEGGSEYKDFVIGYKQDHPNASTSEIVSAYQKQKGEMAGLRYEGLARARGRDVYDTTTGRFVPTNQAEVNRMRLIQPDRFESASYARYTRPEVGDKYAFQKAKEAFTRVPANQRPSSIIASSRLLDKEIPEIVALRYKVEKKNALPGAETFKDLANIEQWAKVKTNDPDVALLRKKVLLLSESLQRIMGSSQGGEWAFNVAKDILDPSFSGEAFERIAYSHGKMLKRLAKEYTDFPAVVKFLQSENIDDEPTKNETTTDLKDMSTEDLLKALEQ